jgi:hypothetical protein
MANQSARGRSIWGCPATNPSSAGKRRCCIRAASAWSRAQSICWHSVCGGVPGIALVGNRLRHENLVQLERFERLYVALDPDAGGQKGTQALVSHLASRVVPVKPPDDDDVGKLATYQDGKEQFAAAIVRAVAATPTDLEPVNKLQRVLNRHPE